MSSGSQRKPRVLIVGIWMVPSSGGMSKTIERFREALDADVVSFTDGLELDREGSAVHGAVHVRTGGDPAGRLYNWTPKSNRGVADALAEKCDLISSHALYRYHVNWVRKIVRQRKTPYWVVPHGSLDPYVLTYRGWQKRLFLALVGRRHLREASHVIFSTRREREKASAIYSGANTRVVPWPVEPVDLSDRDAARSRVRKRLGLPEEAIVLLSLGRLHPMKRPLETIAVVAKAGVPGLHLVLAGPEEGVTRAMCERHAAEHGLRNLHVPGGVWGREKDELLQAVDGFISLSLRENFGHSVAEAMSAGVPVILSPGNDLAGELGDVACGWTLNDDRLETAVSAVRALVDTTPARRCELGASGREFVLRELSFDRFATRLQELAREAVAAGARSQHP